MRLERMLAAADDSPEGALNRNPHPNTNPDHLQLDISSPAERRVAESVSQELDYWERLVFSFDMDRDPSRPSQSDTGSNTRGRSKRRSDQSQTPGVPSTGSGQQSSSSGTRQTHGQQTLDLRQMPNSPFPPIFPNIPGQAPNPQLPHPQLASLDPYTLAHLAALSAIQQGQQPPNIQSQNPADAALVLRQLQSLLFPYGGPAQGNPTSGNATQSFPQQFPQLQQQASSSRFSPAVSRSGSQQAGQSSLGESSSQRWPPQLPGVGSFPFPVPPIDPSLLAQIPQLPPLGQHGAYFQSAQTTGAGPGPSSAGSRARSRSTTTSAASSPTTPASPSDSRARSVMDEAAMSEDKRRRNTLASARFRIKKKHKVLSLERSVVELESRADDLEREASELRRENGWLKEMLIMKGRSVRAQAAAAKAELEQEVEEDEEDEEESGDEVGEDDGNDSEDVPDRKGKGKEKAN